MIKLPDIAKDLLFEESSHTYTYNGKVLTSATSVLSLYKEPFDPDGFIAANCARNEGVTKKEIQDRWKETNRIACDLGHRVHGEIEHYLKTKEIRPGIDEEVVKDFAKIKFKGQVFSELRLLSKNYGIAGTCDIACLDKKNVTIHDLKTNKEFTFKSKYYKKLLYPIHHLADCHINSYSLQILIYGEIIKEYGYSFTPGKLLWVNPETRKIEQFEVLDLQKECLDVLEHFKSVNSF